MAFGLYLGKDSCNAAVRTDQERGALNAHHPSAIHVFFFEDTEGIDDLLVNIGQQGVGQVVLFLEFLLRGRRIGGNPQHYQAGFLQFLVCVAEPARLNGSTGSVGFRIKKEYDVLSAKVGQAHSFAVLVRQTKIRSFIPNFHALSSLLFCNAVAAMGFSPG